MNNRTLLLVAAVAVVLMILLRKKSQAATLAVTPQGVRPEALPGARMMQSLAPSSTPAKAPASATGKAPTSFSASVLKQASTPKADPSVGLIMAKGSPSNLSASPLAAKAVVLAPPQSGKPTTAGKIGNTSDKVFKANADLCGKIAVKQFGAETAALSKMGCDFYTGLWNPKVYANVGKDVGQAVGGVAKKLKFW